MKKLITSLGLAAVMGLPLMASAAHAGPAVDTLEACVRKSATPEDHALVARWFFALMSRNPSVSNMAAISDSQLQDLNKGMGALYTRLMASDCAAEAKTAYAESGEDGVLRPWRSLNFIVMQEALSGPEVQAAEEGFTTFVDEKKVDAALGK